MWTVFLPMCWAVRDIIFDISAPDPSRYTISKSFFPFLLKCLSVFWISEINFWKTDKRIISVFVFEVLLFCKTPFLINHSSASLSFNVFPSSFTPLSASTKSAWPLAHIRYHFSLFCFLLKAKMQDSAANETRY